jgi:hypothetical protein
VVILAPVKVATAVLVLPLPLQALQFLEQVAVGAQLLVVQGV